MKKKKKRLSANSPYSEIVARISGIENEATGAKEITQKASSGAPRRMAARRGEKIGMAAAAQIA